MLILLHYMSGLSFTNNKRIIEKV